VSILTAAQLDTIEAMLFKNRDKPDSPLAEGDLAETIAEVVTLTSATTAELSDAADAINVTNKYAGRLVLDSTTNILQVATGPLATDTWQPVTGATAVTPS
jgi:hypothetical protein